MMTLRVPGSHRLLDHIPPPKHERERHSSSGATVSHIKRSQTCLVPECLVPQACYNFLYGFKGASTARQPSGPPGRIGRSERACIRAMRDDGTSASMARSGRSICGQPAHCGAAACRALPGGSPTGAAPHAGQLTPHPQAVAQA
jgi:hypothetical protein